MPDQTSQPAGNTGVAGEGGAFRWHPAVGVMIFIVLLMLALPMAMIGWHLRGWQQERAQAESGPGPEGQETGLRLALEAVAEEWRPNVQLGLPEIMIEVPPADFVRVNELIAQAVEEGGGRLTLVDSSEKEATYWGRLNQEGVEKIRENLEQNIDQKNLVVYSQNVEKEPLKTRITIKSEK